MKILLSMILGFLLSQTGEIKRGLDEINFSHKIFIVEDTVFWATSSDPFGSDCTFKLRMDSLKANEIYIAGEYDSNVKCMKNGGIDTVRLGILPDGTYSLHYTFKDINGLYETETLNTDFTVSRQSIRELERTPSLAIRYESGNRVVFTLQDGCRLPVQLYLYDATGKGYKVYSMKEKTLQIGDLFPGIYLYRLKHKKENLGSGKFNVAK